MTKWWMNRWLLVPLVAWFVFGSWTTTLQVEAGAAEAWEAAVLIGGGVAAMALALLIAIRRPDAKVGQLFAVATAGFSATPFLLDEIEPLMPDTAALLVRTVGAVMGTAGLAAITWTILLFPDGQHPSRSARLLSWAIGALYTVALPLSLVRANDAGFIDRHPGFDDAFFAAVMVPFIMTIAVLISRFRGASPEVRAQLKWLVFAVAIYSAFLVVGAPIADGNQTVEAAVADTIFYTGIPVAMAIAVLRYRLYEIDRIISRTVSYAVVVGLMVAVYAVVITSIQALLPVTDDIAVAVSTLAGVAAASPLARRIRAWVDRRFFRSRYVAAEVIGDFASELRSTLDPALAATRAENIVGDTFQVESVSVWVAEPPS